VNQQQRRRNAPGATTRRPIPVLAKARIPRDPCGPRPRLPHKGGARIPPFSGRPRPSPSSRGRPISGPIGTSPAATSRRAARLASTRRSAFRLAEISPRREQDSPSLGGGEFRRHRGQMAIGAAASAHTARDDAPSPAVAGLFPRRGAHFKRRRSKVRTLRPTLIPLIDPRR
jgi:hypothetical protein